MKKSGLIIHLALAGILIVTFSLMPLLMPGERGNARDDLPTAAGLRLSASRGMDYIQRPGNASLTDVNLPDTRLPIEFQRPAVSDTNFDKQWGLQLIRAPEVWQLTTGDPNIIVAILDTGIDQYQEDLEGKVVTEINFADSPTSLDVRGHGTHISGIIAASNNNGKGVAGLAPESRLMNVKVADDSGQTYSKIVAKGLVWAADHGASVINLSLSFKEPSSELEAAVNYAWNRGAVVVAAAGNEDTGLPIYPAYYDNCIAVTSSTENDTLAPLSNFGDWVDVAAPGVNIYSTLPDNSYGYKSGTSFATAYVSGLAALLFSLVTDKNGDGRLNDEVRESIESGCLATGITTGKGRIDALRSYEEATAKVPIP